MARTKKKTNTKDKSVLKKMKKIMSSIFRICMAVFFLSVVFTTIFSIRNWYDDTDIFDINRISVCNNNLLSSENVIEFTGIPYNKNIFDIDFEMASKKLTDSPYVESADIRIALPRTVIINITEIKPLAFRIGKNGGLIYLDRNGEDIGPVKQVKNVNLPLINSPKETEKSVGFLCEVLKLSPMLYDRISEIKIENKGLTLYLNSSSVRVIIGDKNYREKIVVLESFIIEESSRLTFEKIEYIDLRFDKQVVLKEFENRG